MCYHAEGKAKPNLIRNWYERQNAAAQADFDNILRVLEVTKDWNRRTDVKILDKEHKGLFEIRFTVNKVRYRPVGFLYSKSDCVLVLGCKKPRRDKYFPANAFDKALSYKKMFLEQNKGTIHERDF